MPHPTSLTYSTPNNPVNCLTSNVALLYMYIFIITHIVFHTCIKSYNWCSVMARFTFCTGCIFMYIYYITNVRSSCLLRYLAFAWRLAFPAYHPLPLSTQDSHNKPIKKCVFQSHQPNPNTPAHTN